MQPSSDQFTSPAEAAPPERGTAEVVQSIDQANQYDYFGSPAPDTESKEDKIARATMNALNVLEKQESASRTPEVQKSIEPYMKNLLHMGAILENFRDMEMKK